MTATRNPFRWYLLFFRTRVTNTSHKDVRLLLLQLPVAFSSVSAAKNELLRLLNSATAAHARAHPGAVAVTADGDCSNMVARRQPCAFDFFVYHSRVLRPPMTN